MNGKSYLIPLFTAKRYDDRRLRGYEISGRAKQQLWTHLKQNVSQKSPESRKTQSMFQEICLFNLSHVIVHPPLPSISLHISNVSR